MNNEGHVTIEIQICLWSTTGFSNGSSPVIGMGCSSEHHVCLVWVEIVVVARPSVLIRVLLDLIYTLRLKVILVQAVSDALCHSIHFVLALLIHWCHSRPFVLTLAF